MKINIYNKQKDLSLSTPSVRKMVAFLLKTYGASSHEVSVWFVSGKAISSLHEEFFQDGSITDCISFPMDGKKSSKGNPYPILGEIFVCPAVAIAYAKEHDKDIYEETSLYVVHGFLHLLGYDDIDPQERKKMRAQERKILKLLRANSLMLTKKKVV